MRITRAAVMVAWIITAFLATAMARTDGAEVYKRCLGCHKATGLGVPGYAPPLATHVPRIEKMPGGRTYLIQVLLYGLKGDIHVNGQRFTSTMPAFGDLNDEEAAAVLNHILMSWANDKLLPKDYKAIAPGEVSAQRANKLTVDQVLAIRGKLGLK